MRTDFTAFNQARQEDHGARYEPYTFNDYGSKIPLHEFRETTEDGHGRVIVLDADAEDTMNVFMVMDEVGDYEIRSPLRQFSSESQEELERASSGLMLYSIGEMHSTAWRVSRCVAFICFFSREILRCNYANTLCVAPCTS